MLGVHFKVVAVSENTNSFGLKQCIMLAQNGLAYKACANSLNIPSKGESVFIPYEEGPNGIEDAFLCFAKKGFEIPERLEDATLEEVEEIYKSI